MPHRPARVLTRTPSGNSASSTNSMTSASRKQPPLRDNRSTQAKKGLTAILFFIALLLVVSLFASVSFIMLRLSQKKVPIIGSTFEELIGNSGSITCQETRSRVRWGRWVDPNNGELLTRKNLDTKPSFGMAVHKEAYDPVRWEHIYVKGKYYEDWVNARFLQILGRHKDDGDDATAQSRGLRLTQQPEKPVTVVLDVGANIGYYTMLSMALGYSVLAFEINPPNLLRMCESLELNHWPLPESDNNSNEDNPIVRFYQNGVSDVDGQDLEVWVPKNPGQAYMKAEESDEKGADKADPGLHHDHTSTISLDTFAIQHGWLIPQQQGNLGVNPNIGVKILKIDVEGKEPLVIEGAQALLRSGIVENVLTEFRRLGRPNVQSALLTLLDSGFTLVHETEGKVSLHRAKELIVDLTDELKGKRQTVDLWFQRL